MKKILIFLFYSLISIFSFACNNCENVLGYWIGESMNGENKSVINIYVDENGSYSGKIVMLINPDFLKDIKNQDENLQDRDLVGINILSDFVYNFKDHEFVGGNIYNAENGKMYYASFWKDGDDLKVRGSLDKYGVFGMTVKWYRPSVKIIDLIGKEKYVYEKK